MAMRILTENGADNYFLKIRSLKKCENNFFKKSFREIIRGIIGNAGSGSFRSPPTLPVPDSPHIAGNGSGLRVFPGSRSLPPARTLKKTSPADGGSFSLR